MGFVEDAFTDATAPDLTSHTGDVGATWTIHPNFSQDLVISDANRCRSKNSTTILYASGAPASAEYDVEADHFVVSTADDRRLAIAGRVDTSATTLYFVWLRRPFSTWQLFKTVAGTTTQIGSFSDSPGVGVTRAVKLEIRDAAKKVYIDGVERISSSDNTITAAGRVGLRSEGNGSNTTGIHIDNLVATDVGVAGSSVSAAYPEGLHTGETFACTITKVCLQSEGTSLSDLKDNIATLLSLLGEGATLGDSFVPTTTLLSLLSEGGQFGETFSSSPTLSSSVSEQSVLGDQSTNSGTLQSSVSEQTELSDLSNNQADLNTSLTEGLEVGETHQGTTGNFVNVTEGLELSDAETSVGSLLVSVSELILTGGSETGDVGTTTATYSEGFSLSEAFTNRADLFSDVSETIELSEAFVGGIEGTVTASWTEGMSLSDVVAFVTEVIITPYLPSRTLLDRRLIAFNMRGQRITYHQFDEKQLSHKTGDYIESFNPTTIDKALIGYVDLEMIETSGGKYKKGDRLIKVMSQDLPETPPSLKDQVTYDSVKHRIVDFDESGDGNVFLLVCRKI